MEISVAEQRERFRAWLLREVGAEPVSFVETHVSILALTADRVWKLKKAVRFPFVDLSTIELRRHNAEREVALNRRFAPDVYLGVVPLDDDGGALTDVVVEMRRMPDDRRLSGIVARTDGATASGCIDGIADALVRIHRDAPTGAGIDRVATGPALCALWRANMDEMRPYAPAILDPELLDRVARDAADYAAGREPLFRHRIDGGRIRDGHGDLLADDVFCLDDGPRFLDCLEFDDRLRYGDVLADVAFLAMDVERLGRRDLASRLLERYRVASGDAWPASLADFYVAYRAAVRSKVACLGTGAAADATSAMAERARALLALAARRLERARVRCILVGGPPAVGKSTLARAVGGQTGWTVLHSDELRKHLAGLDPTTPAAAALDAGLYSPEWTARMYAAMTERAAELLAHGESVVLDASWNEAGRRADIARVAASTSSAMGAFLLSAPADIADERARARARSGTDASDAAPPVMDALRSRFEPWPGAVELDASGAVRDLAARVLTHVGYPL